MGSGDSLIVDCGDSSMVAGGVFISVCSLSSMTVAATCVADGSGSSHSTDHLRRAEFTRAPESRFADEPLRTGSRPFAPSAVTLAHLIPGTSVDRIRLSEFAPKPPDR